MSGALKVKVSSDPDVWTTIGGGSFATEAETVAGVLDDRAVTPAGLSAALPSLLPVINVRDYGAVGDGVADDSAAIQAAIDYCVGGTVAAGAGTIRIARAALHLPAGTYRTTVAPRVVSVMGFHMYGDSMYSTRISVSGARTYGLDLDGLMCCDIHDLQISGTYGLASTDTVRDAIALNWTTAASRSTSNVRFARIIVHELKFTNGMTFGMDSTDRQVDNIWVEACLVNGQWASGDTTWWQAGFVSGNGTHGNVLNHNFNSCGSSVCRYNMWANAVNVAWQGGDVGHAETDFRHTGATMLVVNGVRSEVSQRLYAADGGASYASSAHISNIQFSSTGIHADNLFIKIGYSGTYYLENIVLDSNAAFPGIRVVSTAAKPIYVTAIGLQSRSQLNALFFTDATAPTYITSIGYCQIDSGGLPVNSSLSSNILTQGVNGGGLVRFDNVMIDDSTATLGDNTAAQNAELILNAKTGQQNGIQFRRAGGNAWRLYDANSTILFLRDEINGNMHLSFVAGSVSTGRVDVGCQLRLAGALDHDGTTVGFYGTAPITKPAAVPVTIAGVHAALVSLGLISA